MFATAVRSLCLLRHFPNNTFKQSCLQKLQREGLVNPTFVFPSSGTLRSNFCTNADQKLASTASNGAPQQPNQPTRRHVPLTEEVIQQLAKGDPEKVKQLKLIEFEYEVAKQEGLKVPSLLLLEHWKELLILPSHSGRKKYLSYLFKKEIHILKDKQEKEEWRVVREASKAAALAAEAEEKHLVYGLRGNSILLRVYDSTIEKFNNGRVIKAALFEEPLVFDLSFHQHMTRMEQKLTATQLRTVLSVDREHPQPLPLVFCNADPESYLMEQLEKNFPTLHLPEFPISVTSKNYLDLFPKEKLVYLTPHCNEMMTEFDPDSVYIIGGIVDKKDSTPLTMAKAKREGIRMAKLPLDKYLRWGSSGKSLTLNAMTGILLDLRMTKDWNVALEHVPKRKLFRPEDAHAPTPVLKGAPPEGFRTQKMTPRKGQFGATNPQRREGLNDLLFARDSMPSRNAQPEDGRRFGGGQNKKPSSNSRANLSMKDLFDKS